MLCLEYLLAASCEYDRAARVLCLEYLLAASCEYARAARVLLQEYLLATNCEYARAAECSARTTHKLSVASTPELQSALPGLFTSCQLRERQSRRVLCQDYSQAVSYEYA